MRTACLAKTLDLLILPRQIASRISLSQILVVISEKKALEDDPIATALVAVIQEIAQSQRA